MKRIIALALFGCAFRVMARPAVGISGNDLYHWYDGKLEAECNGYILGAYEVWDAESRRDGADFGGKAVHSAPMMNRDNAK